MMRGFYLQCEAFRQIMRKYLHCWSHTFIVELWPFAVKYQNFKSLSSSKYSEREFISSSDGFAHENFDLGTP